MADLIKTITVNGEQHELGADYNNLDNKPTIPEDKSAEIAALQTQVAALQAQVTALTPKSVKLSWDDVNISKVECYKYYSDTAHDIEPDIITSGNSTIARNGDFGYPTTDESGQVNLGISLVEGYDMVIPAYTAEDLKNYKTPYTTCKDGLYRFTKINKSTEIVFAAAKESDITPWTVTFTKSADEAAGTIGDVTIYRTDDALAEDYAGKALTFTDNVATDMTYDKDTGYVSADTADQAQVHAKFTMVPAEHYTASVTASPKANFKACTYENGVLKITQVKGNIDVAISLLPPVTVIYNPGSYQFSSKAAEVPSSVGLGADLTFKYYYNADTSAVAADVSKAEALARVDSITVGGAAIELSEDYVSKALVAADGDKKVTITIPGAKVTGDVVVTLKTIVTE